MFFKKKCPKCGAKNPKEQMTCTACGAPLDFGQVESQVTEVPTESKTGLAGLKQRFQGVKETLRDKTRDKLCTDLCAIGLDARMADRDQLEEQLGGGVIYSRSSKSIGSIEIRGSPIRWVRVTKHVSGSGQYRESYYSNIYVVPDPTVHRKTQPMFIRVIPIPIFGPVDKLHWESSFSGSIAESTIEGASHNQSLTRLRETIRRLNEDEQLNQRLTRQKGYYMEDNIRSYPEYGCWRIVPSVGYQVDWLGRGGQPAPSRELWDCYETIARHLLEPVESESTGTA